MNLFESQGFEQTTVADISTAAGVTEMTFFRHFASKDLVATADPYDPVIAAGVARRPLDEPPLLRAVRGVSEALRDISEPETTMVRRRVRIVAASPTLRASSARIHEATEARIRDQLIADGTPRLEAHAVAAALIAALTAALFEWARDERLPLVTAIGRALRVLEGADG